MNCLHAFISLLCGGVWAWVGAHDRESGVAAYMVNHDRRGFDREGILGKPRQCLIAVVARMDGY